MKIILSRKGFDSGSGGCASPILPDGRMISLPIPDGRSRIRYGDIGRDGLVGSLVGDLTRGRYGPRTPAHLDPDIELGLLDRPAGWRGAFGQTGTAQSHLRGQGVGVGDLFLYFGWFRDVIQERGSWQFARHGRDIHAIYGWLQVGEIVALPDGRDDEWEHLPWLDGHPHTRRRGDPNNTIYVAAESLTLPGLCDTGMPGFGTVPIFSQTISLTCCEAANRSTWRLPAWFTGNDLPPLSYHADPSRWTMLGDEVQLKSVARGQEFVLDCPARPSASAWVQDLFGAVEVAGCR